jgi:hypothetical protein
MKNFFLLIALSTLTLLCKAQGNLQFNQVLTYNGNLTLYWNGPAGVSPIYTCPTGKVWKIESKTRTPLTINGGQLLSYLNSTSLIDLYPGTTDNSPIWLKAGDNIYFDIINTAFTGNNITTSYYLSIIEYNIVP